MNNLTVHAKTRVGEYVTKSPVVKGNLDYPDEYEQDSLITKLRQKKSKVKFILRFILAYYRDEKTIP